MTIGPSADIYSIWSSDSVYKVCVARTPEHNYCVVRWSAASAEHLDIHHPRQAFQRIADRRQRLQPIGAVKNRVVPLPPDPLFPNSRESSVALKLPAVLEAFTRVSRSAPIKAHRFVRWPSPQCYRNCEFAAAKRLATVEARFCWIACDNPVIPIFAVITCWTS
jgi:hypothetical protein